MKLSIFRFCLPVLLLVGTASISQGQDRIADLHVPTIVTNLELGMSVDLKGDYAILGGPGEGGEQWDAPGEAYIFVLTNDTWVAQAHLVPSDSYVRDRFGNFVAIQDPYAAVLCSNTNEAKAYIFTRTGTNWVETQIITPTGGCESVAFDGTRMVIGSPDEDYIANQSGAVYVYGLVGGTWVQEVRLKADAPHVLGNFGFEVDVEGDRILVGDWTYPATNFTTGKAYLFEYNGGTWDLAETFIASTNDEFYGYYAYDVALNGDQILLGAYDVGLNTWAALYEYSGGTWSETARLDDPLTSGFAHGVVLDDHWMAGGAIGPPAPAAMVYDNTPDDGPLRQIRYTALRTASSEYTYYQGPHFPMAIDGHRIIIGHSDDSSPTAWTNSGALIYTVNTNNRQYRVDGTNQFIHSGFNDGGSGAIAVGEDCSAVAFLPTWETSAVVQVYIETNQRWEVQASLMKETTTDPREFMEFGTALDLDGETLAIGCPNAGTGSLDKVFVYIRNGTNWGQEYMTDLATNQLFGTVVGVAGDLLAMGAAGYDNPTFDEGAVFIHQRTGTNWTLQTTLLPSPITYGEGFGLTLDLITNRLISGSFYAGGLEGKAWIFRYTGGSTWVQEATLQAPVPAYDDYYGDAVAISENYAAVGAPQGSNGEVYVYQRTGTNWNQIALLEAADPIDGDRFGCSVALNDDFLLVGADDKGVLYDQRPGRSYLYRLDDTNVTLAVNSWPGDPDREYEFGKQVALSSKYGAVGVGEVAEGYLLYLPPLTRDILPLVSYVSMIGTAVSLQFTELVPGVTYEVRKTDTMNPADWQEVHTFTAATNWLDWPTTSLPINGFYRLQEQ